MTTCIRRAGSEWTLCKCETCRAEMRRKVKRNRNGIRPVDQRPAALERIQGWKDAGYSVGVVTQMTGIRKATVTRQMDGTRGSISHSTAARVMAASATPEGVGGFVPSTGTWRRLRALTVMGWSMADIAARCDLKESTLHALRDPQHRFTRPMYASAVAEAYERLSMCRGDCRYAATRAIRKGWLPPLAWDDIDDPNENPEINVAPVEVDEVAVARLIDGQRVEATRDERIEALRVMAAAGRTDHQCAQALHVTERTILRWRAEFGIESRWAA